MTRDVLWAATAILVAAILAVPLWAIANSLPQLIAILSALTELLWVIVNQAQQPATFL